MNIVKHVLLIAGVIVFCVMTAYGSEIITLIDGTKTTGDIEHFYRGELTIKVDEKEIVIPASKIKTIEFKLPAPRAEYSSPEKTFRLWEQAVKKENTAAAVECYALMYQGIIRNQMETMSSSDRNRMKQDMESTTFTVEDVKITGHRATMKVLRSFKGDTQTMYISFVKENNEWKMTPQI